MWLLEYASNVHASALFRNRRGLPLFHSQVVWGGCVFVYRKRDKREVYCCLHFSLKLIEKHGKCEQSITSVRFMVIDVNSTLEARYSLSSSYTSYTLNRASLVVKSCVIVMFNSVCSFYNLMLTVQKYIFYTFQLSQLLYWCSHWKKTNCPKSHYIFKYYRILYNWLKCPLPAHRNCKFFQ